MSREFQQAFYVQAFLLESEKLFQVAETRRMPKLMLRMSLNCVTFFNCVTFVTLLLVRVAKARPSKCKVDGVPYLLLQVRRGMEAEDLFNALVTHPQVGEPSWCSRTQTDSLMDRHCASLSRCAILAQESRGWTWV
jgi:hypothetical protein